jgi:GNAT superfamily N-acetyltransferase
MTLELREIDTSVLDQAQKLHDLICKYYASSPWPPTLEKIMSGSAKYFNAYYQERHIGFTGLILKTPQLAETVKTTVFDEFRGSGLGAMLSLAIEDECRKIGVKKVMTTIFHFNHVMISIKLRQGYTIEGYHPHHEAPGFHEYSLGKRLL